MARTALFNWAFARHHGGTFVFRIEDTDAARDTERELHAAARRRCAGSAWTGTRARGRRRRTARTGRPSAATSTPTWRSRLLEPGARTTATARSRSSRSVASAARAGGTRARLRRALPRPRRRAGGGVRGRGPRAGAPVPDARRATSPSPTWCAARSRSRPSTCPTSCSCAPTESRSTPLVNPVDDALMKITHVLRGEDLLSSTPRQIALYRALGRIGVGDRMRRSSATCRSSRARATASCPSATASRTCSATASGLPARGTAQLPGAARLVARRATARSSPWPRWSRRSTSRGSTPTPRGSTSKKREAINATKIRAAAARRVRPAARAVPAERRPGRPRSRRRAARGALLAAAAPLVQERVRC